MTSNNGDMEQTVMVFHPGEFIQDELIARKYSVDKLYCEGWDGPKLKKLLHGEVPIDQTLADHLHTIWGVKQSFYFNLQKMWNSFPDRREMPPQR